MPAFISIEYHVKIKSYLCCCSRYESLWCKTRFTDHFDMYSKSWRPYKSFLNPKLLRRSLLFVFEDIYISMIL